MAYSAAKKVYGFMKQHLLKTTSPICKNLFKNVSWHISASANSSIKMRC
jgi:hypothetical protein